MSYWGGRETQLSGVCLGGLRFCTFRKLGTRRGILKRHFGMSIILRASAGGTNCDSGVRSSVRCKRTCGTIGTMIRNRGFGLVRTLTRRVTVTLFTHFSKLRTYRIGIVGPSPPVINRCSSITIRVCHRERKDWTRTCHMRYVERRSKTTYDPS